MEKLCRYSSTYYDLTVKADMLGDVGHVLLDLIGIIPGAGEFADATNALWYAIEGDYLFAALSLISVIPEIGDAIGKGGKLATWLTRAFPKGVAAVAKYGPDVAKAIRALRGLIRANRDLIDKIFDKAEENEKLSQHVPKMRDALDIFDRQE